MTIQTIDMICGVANEDKKYTAILYIFKAFFLVRCLSLHQAR